VNDFERIARIIRYLDRYHLEQPSLGELAKFAGLSISHFYRLFTKWAGATPKDFLQCLTHKHARQLLKEGASVLNAAVDSGLSGPGRLHDLCVTVEAATPGEIKDGGQGLRITYGFGSTPFGECIIAETDRGICHLRFIDRIGREAALTELKAEWPKAKLKRNDVGARAGATLMFALQHRDALPGQLRVLVKGSEFQLRVWQALVQVPLGKLVSYGQLADAIEAPGAARAVGTAVGANPIAWLIPCHRVIRETGVVGEYRWGRERKRALIAWESLTGRELAA
jgi:AraC family transcriptional regulator, regulatory protein of adaptative response / methylated-DNA-[protein]-cysteine methyltransferase